MIDRVAAGGGSHNSHDKKDAYRVTPLELHGKYFAFAGYSSSWVENER